SLSRALLDRDVLDQEVNNALVFQRLRGIERRAAVGVRGVDVDAEPGGQLDGLENERLTLAALHVDPGFAAAHTDRRHQRRRDVLPVLKAAAARPLDDAIAALDEQWVRAALH